jgi:hypothetical protein
VIHPVTVERAWTLRRRYMRAAFCVLAVAWALWAVGVRDLFLPLALVCWVLMARGLQWDGWVTGYRAARSDDRNHDTEGDPA